MKKKSVIICGVTDMDGNPVKLSEEEKNEFTKKVAGDDYIAVFSEEKPILTLNVLKKNNENY